MRFLVTGATGFLGWRAAGLLEEAGHEVVRLARPGRAARAHAAGVDALELDAGDPAARDLVAGCAAVLHFAGIPDPRRAREDPARAVRENAGTTVNLLEGCREHGAGLVYPSTVRAAVDPPPDPYAVSKRLGEAACALHGARATVLRLTSVFGPGQVAAEGATGAIASFAARALAGKPIVIPGDPRRTRDFLYVDDLVRGIASLVEEERWGETLVAASGRATPLVEAAALVRDAAGSDCEIVTPGGELPAGEDASYAAPADVPSLRLDVHPLGEAIRMYVDWLRAR
ncbi:MAG TPA: NAD-dependent epimerase/dehydratase family protein [Gaiellaceae bacterium]|nr:NAD-dependent epimerase/dehydratase family protein [Gaiellaceae bacterium]